MDDVVSQEVHKLLALDCAHAILNGLVGKSDGLTDREISADVVGSAATEKTVVRTRKKFTKAGWIAPAGAPVMGEKGHKAQRWRLTDSGEEARLLGAQSDRVHVIVPAKPAGSTRNDGVGVVR